MSVETGPAPSATSQKVFICYRRDETSAHAGRLYDAMVARFGEGNVFMDVELPPGVDFEERITEVVSGCVALLVVMGRNWVSASNEDGTRRIDEPDDFVRLELQTALGNPRITPIPVLVHGAQMPRREELPPELRPLARRNAIELSDGRWRYDVERLIDSLDGLLPGGPKPQQSQPQPEPEIHHGDRRLLAQGAVFAALSAGVGRLLAEPILESMDWGAVEDGAAIGKTLTTLTAYSVIAAVPVGAALALWLTLRAHGVGLVRRTVEGVALAALAGAVQALFWGGVLFPGGYEFDFDEAAIVQLGSLFLFGGVLGLLVGRLWRPRRPGVGFAAGAAAGVLFQLLFVFLLGWKDLSTRELASFFGLATGTIVAGALLAMVAWDRSEPGAAAGRGR